jgi:hypothetical protein
VVVFRNVPGGRRRVSVVVALALWLALPGVATAQSGSLEDALGDSLEVRRDGTPIADEPDGTDADDDGGGTDGGSSDGGGSGGGSGQGPSGPDAPDADAPDAGSGDGLRDPVAPDADAPAGGDGAPAPADGDDDADGSDDALELQPGETGVDGEGRGPGELALTGDASERAVPIAVAALMVIGSLGAVLNVGRRELGGSGGAS